MAGSVFDMLDDIEVHSRAQHFDADHYDYAVEDDDDALGYEAIYDDFNCELLHQPFPDRQRQASQGLGRLSLPPRPAQDVETGQSRRTLLDLETSSSPKGLPSSPAFRAGQRRASGFEASRQLQHARSDYPGPSSRHFSQAQSTEQPPEDFRPSYIFQRSISPKRAPQNLVQGIELVSTRELPDRLRSIFRFPNFNAVQSKCFQTVFRTNDNFVLSSPTSSGKTAVLELAICRTIHGWPNGECKIIYQAPTKALCSERFRDWSQKFGPLDLRCAELTGDTDQNHLRNVQSANIIITTPEKWDSITRKWKDHEKLMRLVKLFLIDEVHMLGEDRGATLEAVVSRMKSVGSDVRFVALSTTVPNSEDIAVWLGKDPMNQDIPAPRERFGEEFRPVKLQKHVCGYQGSVNEFAFEKVLDAKLPGVIKKYSHKKPLMVFCFTRASAENTAKQLANWWATKGPRDRHWEAPRKAVAVADQDLRSCVSSAVAWHHAGLRQNDRIVVETGFLNGDINVICCTSTLAVGVNLPCHFVIIKNTVTYQGTLVKEYADIEIMQMLGRAGRPQFDVSAVAVIMTRAAKVQHYEKMISGQEILESCLHLNLIEHLNAEIGLGTITNLPTAKRWLAGTFLYVRLKQNPDHYKLDGSRAGADIDEQLEDICIRSISSLQNLNLVTDDTRLKTTEFGDAMARYYMQFNTMRVFLGLPQRAKLSEIVSALSQAAELKEVRFRSGEKPLYKDLNKSPSIKFPIPVDLALPAHKVSLIIQSVLGGAELPTDESMAKHKLQYNTEIAVIFQHVHRLIRCIIDCQLHLEDSISSRNALTLARSLASKCWDDSPLQMRQVPRIGVVGVRKLVNAGIKSMKELEAADTHRIETTLSKAPPYGKQLMHLLSTFPKLRVSLKMMGQPIIKPGEHVRINVKADMGFMNERTPETWEGKPVYVCFLAETSDGHKIHFCRISARKLNNGQDVLFAAILTSPNQSINCYVMCDEFAGTLEQATLKPNILSHVFPPAMNTSRKRAESVKSVPRSKGGSDEFGLEDLDDSDLMNVDTSNDSEFRHIDSFTADFRDRGQVGRTQHTRGAPLAPTNTHDDWGPTQLSNGKWQCNHQCKDKSACRHMCCREGVDKPPKAPPKKRTQTGQPSDERKTKKSTNNASSSTEKTQTTLKLRAAKRGAALPTPSSSIAQVDLSQSKRAPSQQTLHAPRDVKNLRKLHTSVQNAAPSAPTSITQKTPGCSYAAGGHHNLSFMPNQRPEDPLDLVSSDHGDFQDLARSTTPTLAQDEVVNNMGTPPQVDTPQSDYDFPFGDEDSTLEDAICGLADSQDMQSSQKGHDVQRAEALQTNIDHRTSTKSSYFSRSRHDDDFDSLYDVTPEPERALAPEIPTPHEKGKSLFLGDTSSSSPAFQSKQVQDSRQVQDEGRPGGLGEPAAGTASETAVRAPQGRSAGRQVVMPPGYEGIEPWLIEMFADCVEFV